MAKTFGGTIAELRKQKGLSQDELARKAGVSRNYIVKIEKGTATNLGARIVNLIAKALQEPPDQLFTIFIQYTEKETQCQGHT